MNSVFDFIVINVVSIIYLKLNKPTSLQIVNFLNVHLVLIFLILMVAYHHDFVNCALSNCEENFFIIPSKHVLSNHQLVCIVCDLLIAGCTIKLWFAYKACCHYLVVHLNYKLKLLIRTLSLLLCYQLACSYLVISDFTASNRIIDIWWPFDNSWEYFDLTQIVAVNCFVGLTHYISSEEPRIAFIAHQSEKTVFASHNEHYINRPLILCVIDAHVLHLCMLDKTHELPTL